ncbi:hypothetical protein B6V01_004070, partial [Methanosarcinales archaeon ex4572_44]
MPIAERNDPYQSFRFLVEIHGLIVGGFSEVSGLQAETETEEIREGGVNDHVHKLPKITKYPNITLKRGITDSDILWRWHRDMSETMRPDKFIILRGLSKHGSIAISDLNFSGWINNKHKVFRRRKTLFPTLIFRIRKHFSMSQQFLPKNATALMENRVRYSGKHSLSKIHLRLDVLTIFKDWAKKDEVSSKSRRIGLSRFYSLCIHPGSYFPEYKSHLEFTVNPIFSETSNILADAKHGKPGSSPSGIAPPFPK